jgi:RNA polymerase sigma factor (sigma-70 family)
MSDAQDANGRQELEVFLASNRPRLVRLAWRILRDEHEAEDIVQETLAAVLRRLETERPRKIGAYVYAAVERNALKALARRRTGVPLDAQAAWSEGEQDDADEQDIDPLTLEQALLQLPPAQQVVIRMKYYMGYTFRQTSEALAISINTAASRCRYALAALRAQLGRRPDGSHSPQDEE